MSPVPLAERVRNALDERVGAVVSVLGIPPRVGGEAGGAAAGILGVLEHARATGSMAELWLLAAAVGAALPDADTLVELRRSLALDGTKRTADLLVDGALTGSSAALDRKLEIVVDTVLVDVDFAARSVHNTGIQRVIRRTVPHWPTDRFLPVTADEHGVHQRLTAGQRRRLLDWDANASTRDDADEVPNLVLPWRSRVVLMEVPIERRLAGLAALARFSGSTVSAIGYDAIPVASRESVNRREADKFAAYLGVVKYMTVVAGISASAAEEFAGFASTLSAQGLTGPRTISVPLPVDHPTSATSARGQAPVSSPSGESTAPLVLCVGSKEPRKNHVAVMVAAERLWAEGLRFDLLLVGAYGWDTRLFRRWLRRLERRGRSIDAPHRTTDSELEAAYARARFTVFPSLHEGFGLPIAESLAHGVPVITSDYGSTAEIAIDGGCLQIDPRDDDQLRSAMRELLTDDERLGELRAEITRRPVRGWADYADETWRTLVDDGHGS